MNQTNPKLITLIVVAISILAAIGVCSICMTLFFKGTGTSDPMVLTAIISITSGLVGSLTTLLSNTRSTAPGDVSTTSATTTATTTTGGAVPPAIPVALVPPPKPIT